MKPREVYRNVGTVRQIVDAYARLVPWGGLAVTDVDRQQTPVEFEGSQLVTALLVDGTARADVRVGAETRSVDFTYSEMGDEQPFSLVGAIASVARPLMNAKDYAGAPDAADYFKLLVTEIEGALGLPYWLLNQSQVAKAEVMAVKWALVSVLGVCERYRHPIRYYVQQAFGGRADWRDELRWDDTRPRVLEYSNLYRAFCEALGVELTPLRTEALAYIEAMRGLNLGLMDSEMESRIRSAFERCPSVRLG